MMTYEEMIAALEAMLANLKAQQAPPIAYPRVIEVAGARFNVLAPINENWQPSQYGRIFGRRMILDEPSNAPEGSPLRSPAGYPLIYGVGPARVLYGDSTFASDEMVEQYRAAVAASEAGQAQRDREQGYDFSGGKSAEPTGEVEIPVQQG